MKKIISIFMGLVFFIAPITNAQQVKLSNPVKNLEVEGIVMKDNMPVLRYKEPPKFYSTKSTTNEEKSGALGWTDYELLSSSIVESDAHLGNHPSFSSNIDKYANGIMVSSSSTGSASISLGYGIVSISYSPASSGGITYSNPFKGVCRSKVILVGDIKKYNYRAKEYNGAGILIKTYTFSSYAAQDTFPAFEGLESPYIGEIRYAN